MEPLVKFIVCALIIAYVSIKQTECAMSMEQMEKSAKGFRDNCIKKTGADPGMVAGVKQGEFPDNSNLKCYTYCIMKSMRMMKNNEVDMDMTIKQIQIFMPEDIQDRLISAAKSCNPAVTSSENCEAAYQYVKCTYNADPGVFFFP